MEPVSGVNRAQFDFDLRYGQVRETLARHLLTDGPLTVEVKTDGMSELTGNVIIEFECRGKPSGIAVTTARWWAFVIGRDSVMVFIRTDRLKTLARKFYMLGKVVAAGELGPDGKKVARGVLIPVSELVKVTLN